MTRPLPIIAVSMGDPAGIGLECLLELFKQHQQGKLKLSPFLYVGSANLLLKIAAQLKKPVPISYCRNREEILSAWPKALPIWTPASEKLDKLLSAELDWTAGQPCTDFAAAIIGSIDEAVHACASGLADSICTLPINKALLAKTGFTFPGHTEFLAALCQKYHLAQKNKINPVMMMASPSLRTVPITVHIALSEVSTYLTAERIIKTVKITYHALQTSFGIADPQLAISGLNPHAGENGLMGNEEAKIMQPAIDECRRGGIGVQGPFSADSLFTPENRIKFDAILCPTHDQALIPVKALDFEHCVNVTLGLPIIRTSPDHGTAYDIAGKGEANPQHLFHALTMAGKLASNRLAAGSKP